jgi:hypothetical protein
MGLIRVRLIASVALAALLSGCADLLPKSRTETEAAWTSFDQARAAIEKIVPYETRKADLKALGIGVDASRSAAS